MTRGTLTEARQTVCCSCGQQCGVLVHVADGRVTRISGDKTHPISRGFVCPKGSNAHVLHYDGTRIHRPLKRVGARGSGEWQEIGWDAALDEIAATIGRLADSHGPETLAHSFGTFRGADWAIGQRFMNLFGSPNGAGQDKVCYGPNALGEALTYGFGPTFNAPSMPGTTRCIVLWGMRPSASTPLLWKLVLQTCRAGAKLIVVDPERTREAARADLWLQPRPGTDPALALSFIHCVISEGLHDAEFVREQTVGFDDLQRRAADYAPARVAEICGVPAEKIVAAARMLATNRPAMIHGGNGLCQSGPLAVQSGRALACLLAITGNVGVFGGHLLGGPPRDIVANGEALLAGELSEEQQAKRLGGETFPHVGRGQLDLDRAMSPAWYGKRHLMDWLTSAHEPSLWQAITTGQPYPVTALIVQNHNPLGASANAQAVAAALTSENLELLVVHDLFVNATSRLADYLLPAAHWLEKPFFSVGLGYLGFAGDYVEAKSAPIAAEHEHRSDYDFWRDLGRRLGQAEQWPDSAQKFWGSLLHPAGLSFASVSENVGPLFGESARAASGNEDARAGWGTPSRKVELRSTLLESWGLDPLPYFELPAIFQEAAHSYPLVLTTGGRVIEGFHQHSQQMPSFRRKHRHPVVRLHPDTAVASGVTEGQWIRIETPVGAVRQQVRLAEELAPGVVHADRWWYPERADDKQDPFGFWATNINVCTDDATQSCDPIMGTWLLRGLPCRIAVA